MMLNIFTDWRHEPILLFKIIEMLPMVILGSFVIWIIANIMRCWPTDV